MPNAKKCEMRNGGMRNVELGNGVAGNKSEASVHASHKLSPQAKATPFIP